MTGTLRMSAVVILCSLTCKPALAQDRETPAPDRLRDRGAGLPTSLFGTYVRRHELLVYPFFEYYRDADFEYNPAELGGVDETDYRGRYRAREGLLFVGYGVTDDLAIEFEVAGISASLVKSPGDPSPLPPRLHESGLGDVEGQVRWRWRRETDRRPEVFSYAELVVPHHRNRPLTGTGGWQVKLGTGLVRGYNWGTLTARGAVEYDAESSSRFDVGEYAIEYLKRLSPSWRIFAGIEGTQDEIELIGELQWHVTRRVFFKFNSGLGLTSKATDWAPEVGVVFSFSRQ